MEDENLWLSQAQMAELFQMTPQNVATHLKNIYSEGELNEISTCKEYLQVQNEGNRAVERKTKFYNLDTIIASVIVSVRLAEHSFASGQPKY